MNDNTYFKPCTKCGRPQTYCKGECCGKPQGCQCKEYGPKACGCIRQKAPECPYEAVIPSVTVESISNLKDLADCFVHVSDINTTFYIDDKHRIITTWAGLVSVNDYDFEANPLNLRGQIAYDAKNNKAAIYDKQGVNYIFQISDIENDYMLLENKPAINGVTLEGNKTAAQLGILEAEETALMFDTVADMQASTKLENGGYARTLGFHSIGDGGGALYKITDTGTADGMTVIAVGDLYANLIYNGEVSSEQLGCYNDEVHDDATYIQKAIDLSKSLGVKVKFAHDEYYVSTAINIPQEFSIDFQGITLKAMVAAAFTKGMLNIESTWNIHNGVISNLKFDQNNTAPKAIYINRSWRRTYENIDIKNTPSGGYGIYIDGANGNAGGNQFNNITGSGNYRNSTFIWVGANDNVFSHVDYQQYTIGIHTSRFARLFDIHGYVATDTQFPDDWYTNSIFIKLDSNASIFADELYPDTQNYVFYNASVIPSTIGKVFFTFNTNTSQGENNPCVMFKALNDNVGLYYRWKVLLIDLGISQDDVDFELIKNATDEYLSTYIHIKHITGSGDINMEVPPTYVERILPQNNFTKLGIYGNTLVATGTCQYSTGSSERDVCKLRATSGFKLIDGYYSFKGINPTDSSVYDGTVKVESNKVTIMPNAAQGANFQFFISLPAIEFNAKSGSY